MKSFTVKYNLQRDPHYIFRYFNTRHLSRMFHEDLARLQKMLVDTKTMKKNTQTKCTESHTDGKKDAKRIKIARKYYFFYGLGKRFIVLKEIDYNEAQ